MKRAPLGSYEEARRFSLLAFSHLTPAQKLQWLAQMAAFIDQANPQARLRRFGLLKGQHPKDH